ncbi:serine protease [Pelomonas sp. KK5]|uniref:S1 family peptidase n=1 Tax=Pelomonas sp. KK5 TaxID=1855730 RepID=UPI0018E9C1E9|nr:serine protease [Pelomonas sp. KK5]
MLMLPLAWGTAPAADLPELIERSKPSVALIGTYAETDSPRFGFRGTGFVVGNGNLAITNAHVLPPPMTGEVQRRLVVQLRRANGDWAPRTATVLALDKSRDLALLKFDGPAAPALALRKTIVREGTSIALMGFPLAGALGFSTVTHRGIVSAITGVAMPTPSAQSLNASAALRLREGAFEILQLDATAYPGNSGGPVIDVEAGDVVGVINMVVVKRSRESALSDPSGITYAIPAGYAAALVDQELGIKP